VVHGYVNFEFLCSPFKGILHSADMAAYILHYSIQKAGEKLLFESLQFIQCEGFISVLPYLLSWVVALLAGVVADAMISKMCCND
jgi:hypothetical protein